MDGFETSRLAVEPLERARGRDAAVDDALAGMLTRNVLRYLPPALDPAGAPIGEWIAERERESDVFLVTRKGEGQTVGVLLVSHGQESACRETRHVGCLLAEGAWGRGYCSEVLSGLARRMRGTGVRHLVGGADIANRNSARAMQKAGFRRSDAESTAGTDVFMLDIAR